MEQPQQCQKTGTAPSLPPGALRELSLLFVLIFQPDDWQRASAGKQRASHGSGSALQKVSGKHKPWPTLSAVYSDPTTRASGRITQCCPLINDCLHKKFLITRLQASWK